MLPLTGARVLVTADAVGGVWTYALDLAGGLAALDVETALAVLGPAPAPDQAEAARAVPGLRLFPTGLPLDWLAETPGEVEVAGASLAARAAEIRADLVHLHSPALAAGARFPAPVVASCHSCVGTWWEAVRGGGRPLPPDFAWRARLVARGCAEAGALLAPTAAFAAATTRFYGLPKPPAVVGPALEEGAAAGRGRVGRGPHGTASAARRPRGAVASRSSCSQRASAETPSRQGRAGPRPSSRAARRVSDT